MSYTIVLHIYFIGGGGGGLHTFVSHIIIIPRIKTKNISCLRRWTKTYHEITFIIERNQETTEKKNIHMGAAIVAGVLGYQTRF